jgi:hypothetical protein
MGLRGQVQARWIGLFCGIAAGLIGLGAAKAAPSHDDPTRGPVISATRAEVPGSIVVAQSGGFLDFLFGGGRRLDRPAAGIPSGPTFRTNDGSGLSITVTPAPPGGGAGSGSLVYCVRTCDGFYFPISATNASVANQGRLCQQMCPGATTEVFRTNGSGMENATNARGRTYSKLPTAFDFRKRYSSACSCRGNNNTGMTQVSITNDVTLRSGDIVVTSRGLRVFSGGSVPFRDSNFSAWRGGDSVLAEIDTFYRSGGSRVITRAAPQFRSGQQAPRYALERLEVRRVPLHDAQAVTSKVPTSSGKREIRQFMPQPVTTSGETLAGSVPGSNGWSAVPPPPWTWTPTAPTREADDANLPLLRSGQLADDRPADGGSSLREAELGLRR